ncbi:MAG: hypothetical protein Kow00129_10270 [Thermoleophilia bacterium]
MKPAKPLQITALVLLLAAGGVVSGCGEEVAERVVEEAAEQAAESESGQEIDVDIDAESGEGRLSVTDDTGQAEIGYGEGTEVPEGFPDLDLPDDSVVTAGTKVEDEASGTSYSVQFSVDASPSETYAHFVESLPGNGYEIVQQMEMGGEQSGFSLVAVGDEFELTVFGSADGVEEGSMFVISAAPVSE